MVDFSTFTPLISLGLGIYWVIVGFNKRFEGKQYDLFKTWKWLGVFLLLFGFFQFYKLPVFHKSPLEKLVQQTREQQSFPMMIDSNVRYDDIRAVDGKEIEFVYTLLKISETDAGLTEILGSLKTELHNHACSDKQSLSLLKDNIRVTFLYYSKEGNRIAKYSWLAADCR